MRLRYSVVEYLLCQKFTAKSGCERIVKRSQNFAQIGARVGVPHFFEQRVLKN